MPARRNGNRKPLRNMPNPRCVTMPGRLKNGPYFYKRLQTRPAGSRILTRSYLSISLMTNSIIAVVFTIVLSGLLMVAKAAPPSESDFTPVEKLPVVKDLPDPFLFNDDTRVKTRENWPRRRAELQEAILHYQYGQMPPQPRNTT